MEGKVRGWINIVGALLTAYFTYSGSSDWAMYIVALLFIISGAHHAFGK